jgi:hypothetical protein
MVTLPAGAGFGGAARQLYSRHRFAVLSAILSIVGIATGTAAALSLLRNADPTSAIALGSGALLATACCLMQTRHVGLAVLTALAPLPGLLWAAPLSGGHAFGAIPFVAYAIGFAVAALQAQATVERIVGDRAENPWRAAMVAGGLMIVLGGLWFWGTESRGVALQSIADVGLATLSALVLLPIGSVLLTFNESFVARANRIRERRQRIVERIALVTTQRWALSVAGIALVFLALGWFESEPVARSGNAALALRTVSVVVVAIGAGLFVRSWRDGLAISLMGATAALMSLWFAAYGPQTAGTPVCVLQTTMLALLVAVSGARRGLVHSTRGDAIPLARQRAVEDMTIGQIFAGAGAVLTVLPALVAWPAYAPFAVGLIAATVAGVLFAPAIATVFDAFLPRHHAVERLYGARSKAKVRTVGPTT